MGTHSQKRKVSTHNVSFGGLAQQAPEGDDRRHAGAVEEEHRGQTLQTQRGHTHWRGHTHTHTHTERQRDRDNVRCDE